MKSPINRRNGPVQLEELCNLNIHIKARPSTVSPRTSDTKILWHRNGALSGAIMQGLDKGDDSDRINYLARLVRAAILASGRDIGRVFLEGFPRAKSAAITLVPRRMARLPDIITIGRLATIYVYDADANQLEGRLRAALRLERGQDSLRAAA